jgi:formate hydrogenlyase subunit 3/multisubunit Na+/H+ antiporter MnhD subunit
MYLLFSSDLSIITNPFIGMVIWMLVCSCIKHSFLGSYYDNFQMAIQADPFYMIFVLHICTLAQLVNLCHFSNLHDNFCFNMTGIDDLWPDIAYVKG